MSSQTQPEQSLARKPSWGSRLYSGDVSIDFVGRQRQWYVISAVLLLICVLALVFRGLTAGIEFKGGAEFTVDSPSASISQARSVTDDTLGAVEVIVQKVGEKVRIQTPELTPTQTDQLEVALAAQFKVTVDDLSARSIGPSWGSEITRKAVTGLIVFFVLVVVFLSIVFEWRMAVAAMAALVHDLVVTVGIYALSGFEVTPATVIGFLTILGYSLYDTVVVFDKVRENTRGLTGGSRFTYSEAANLAVNQTLIRSINTSVIALLPVGAILVIGWLLLGAGTLLDLALALFIGIAVGTYSSIFIATPLLADLKERDPAMVALRKRVLSRRAGASRSLADDAAAGGDERERVSADLGASALGTSDLRAEPPGTVGDARPIPGSPPRAGAGRNQPRNNRSRAAGARRPNGKRRS